MTTSLEGLIILGADAVTSTRYCSVAMYALMVYDWLVSLSDEVELIWRAPCSTIKSAYMICRYAPVILFPFYLWAWVGNHTFTLCANLVHPLYAFLVLFHLSPNVVIIMRTYAFTGRNKVVLATLCTSLAAVAAAEIWLFGIHYTALPKLYAIYGNSGCFGNVAEVTSLSVTNAPSGGIVWLAAFLMDLLMMLTVLVHCMRIKSTQGALGRYFLLQGVAVFATMSTLNLLTSIIFFSCNHRYDGITLPLVVLIPNVLVCQLIITLRRRLSPTESEVSKEQSRVVRQALELRSFDDAVSVSVSDYRDVQP